MIGKFLIILLVGVLSACHYDVAPVVSVPQKDIQVHAGSDRVLVPSSGAVTLKGTLIPAHTIVEPHTIQWQQIEGKQSVTIAAPSKLTTDFSAPSLAGNYTFKLTLTDQLGHQYSDEVTYVFQKDRELSNTQPINDQQLFEQFWQIVHANHAFIDKDYERWQQLYHVYQSQSEPTLNRFNWTKQVSKMLHALQDESLEVIPTNQVLGRKAERLTVQKSAFSQLRFLCEKYSDVQSNEAENPLTWCVTAGNIGLVSVGAMPDKDISQVLLQALKDLRNTNTVILDLSGNSGEHISSAIQLAQAFLNRADTSLHSVHYFSGESVASEPINISPSPYSYHGRVMVLTNAQTSGSAELLTYLLKQSPGNLHIGHATEGKMSLRETHSLPNGFTLRLAKNRFLDTDHQIIGLSPIEPALSFEQVDEKEWLRHSIKIARQQ